MQSIIERFLGSDVGRAVARQQAEEDLAKRRELVAGREDLRREQARKAEAAQVAGDRISIQVADLERELTEAHSALARARLEQLRVSVEFDGRVGAIDCKLLATAPAEISAFIADLESEFDRTRAAGVTEEPVRDGFGRVVRVGVTNVNSVSARLAAIREARRAAERLKLEALPPEELTARLEALRAGLPQIDYEPIEA